MPDALGTLGRHVPHVEGCLQELVVGERVHERQPKPLSLFDALGPVESALAGDDDALGYVPKNRIGGAAERAPGAGAARTIALLPDDLAAQEQLQVVWKDANHVRREAAVRLSPEVRHVDGDAPARLELAFAFREHISQKLEVLEIRPWDAFTVELFFVALSHEVWRR